MNCTAIFKTSAAPSAVMARPQYPHSNVSSFGNSAGRKIDRANRMGLPHLIQHCLCWSAFIFTFACNKRPGGFVMIEV